MSNFYAKTNIKKARKEHACQCCNSLILKGESYVKIAGNYEGNFFTHLICPQCDEILEWYFVHIDIEYNLSDVIGENCYEEEVYKLLKQIKHPSEFVLGCIEDYENEVLNDKNNYHIEMIICPNCNHIQEAKVEHRVPWWTYFKICEKCGYVIMESEWNNAGI